MRVLNSSQQVQGVAERVPAAPETGLRRVLRVYGQPAQRYGEYALGAGTLLGMLLSVWAAFVYAPTDATQGPAQRIFYFHVPIALDAYLAFFVVFLASVGYLWRGDERWDWVAKGAAEIGTLFTTLTLISGSLWGRPIWGTWWVWDARLTTSLIMWFIYVGYLLLRTYTGRTSGGARAAAVLGIIGFVDVPINYLSVTWWRTLHPIQVLPLGGTPQMPPTMLLAFMLSMVTFLLLFGWLLIQSYRLERAVTLVQRLRATVEYADD